MSDILKEVRAISSQKLAEKQSASENKYPDLIKRIKSSAEQGKTHCKFSEHEIDEYSKRLLEADGFNVYATTETPKYDKHSYIGGNRDPISIWVVKW